VLGRIHVLVTWIALGCAVASATSAADLVIVWAPNANVAPVEEAARKAGAAPIDRSPPPAVAPDTARLVRIGIDAYDALRLEDAMAALDRARDAVDKTGAAGVTTAQLSDLFLYRGLVKIQLANTGAFDELATAIVVDPERDLDPARFPPKVAEELKRAHDTVLQNRQTAPISITAPPGCETAVDGTAQTTAARYITGPHWVRAVCPDHSPWGGRVDLTTLGAQLQATPAEYAPPSEDALLVHSCRYTPAMLACFTTLPRRTRADPPRKERSRPARKGRPRKSVHHAHFFGAHDVGPARDGRTLVGVVGERRVQSRAPSVPAGLPGGIRSGDDPGLRGSPAGNERSSTCVDRLRRHRVGDR